MRGKARMRPLSCGERRITPAYAGKRTRSWRRTPQHRGSPPRMRGKAGNSVGALYIMGITPAYAGKRNILEESSPIHKDHPRVCGEKLCFHAVARSQLGSPPHMRGKAQAHLNGAEYLRITPAYAGKRRRARPWTLPYWDHPRVCGEKRTHRKLQPWQQGSPPRMRGKVQILLRFQRCVRITPAYAGKS